MRNKIKDFFFLPYPKLDWQWLAGGGALVTLGIILAIQLADTRWLLVSSVGIVVGVLGPLTARMDSKTDSETNPKEYMSLFRYLLRRRRFQQIPLPRELGSKISNAFRRIIEDSYVELGIDSPKATTRKPIMVYAVALGQVIGLENSLVGRRSLKDPKGYLYSTYRVTVLQFMRDFLGVYEVTYNVISDSDVNESMVHCFYRSVASTQVSRSNFQLDSGEKFDHSTIVELNMLDGKNFRVVIDNLMDTSDVGLPPLGSQAARNIVQNILDRARVGERKFG